MYSDVLFYDRREAGLKLAESLSSHIGKNMLVLALPRGGVPVAHEVAKVFSLPLDVLLVRKLGVPGQEELAMGAIATGGVSLPNREVVEQLGITTGIFHEVEAREADILRQREQTYRQGRPPLNLKGRNVILVDDGLATGSTMQAAVATARNLHASSITVAAPVGSKPACKSMLESADEVVCYATPDPFISVGRWYVNFDQTTDEEVLETLSDSALMRRD